MSGNSGKRQKWTVERFYKEATEVHGDKYEYEDLVDVRVSTRLTVKCKKHGRVFHPSVADHIYKESGCPSCKGEISGLIRKELGICSSREEFIRRAIEVHGDKYDYSRTVVGSTRDKVTVVCRVPGHGEFYPTPTNHVHSATGCPVCGQESTTSKRTDSQEKFISDCVAVHGDKYDYSKTVYVSSRVPIVITCDTHGDFVQVAEYHRNGSGCVSCSERSSRPQVDITAMILESGITTIVDYKLPSGLEVDVYCPDLNVGFEYDGLYWHSSANGKDARYHLSKTMEAASIGIELIHVFEDEWVYQNDLCREYILSKVGITSTNLCSEGLLTKQISKEDYESFPCLPRIVGNLNDHAYLGVFQDDIVVGSATLRTTPCEVAIRNMYSIVRDDATLDSIVSYVRKTYTTTQLAAVVDARWCRPSLYLGRGFVKVDAHPPRKYYTKNQRRYTEDEMLSLAKNRLVDPNSYYEVHDCGESIFSMVLP